MSQANVELYLHAIDAWNRRDFDAWLPLADPEIEVVPLNLEMEGGDAYRGHEGMRRFWDDYLAVFPDMVVEVDELRDLGEVTLARARLRGHGTESDASFEQPVWQVLAWRGGKCVWWRGFRTEAEALDAAAARAGAASGG
ncbi:MAG TPA: nuclear transport factor 2 family protein [Solirubrobacterales bacterium]|jgi:ketosteroid isomerase-like protein|nr:nuclear transport factor 2 family protein [Solirubrobacterales bacterium]